PPPLTQTAKNSINQVKITPEALAEKRKTFFSQLRQQRLKEKADFKIQDHVDAVWQPPTTTSVIVTEGGMPQTPSHYLFEDENCLNCHSLVAADIGKTLTYLIPFVSSATANVHFSSSSPYDALILSSSPDGTGGVNIGQSQDNIMCSFGGPVFFSSTGIPYHLSHRFKVGNGGSMPINIGQVLKERGGNYSGSINCTLERTITVPSPSEEQWFYNTDGLHTFYLIDYFTWSWPKLYLLNKWSASVKPSYHVDLTVEPMAFYPGSAQTEWPSLINFHLDTGPNEETWIEIYGEYIDANGETYWKRTPVLAQVAEPDGEGSRTVVWDGRNTQGQYLPPGNYVAFAYSYNWDDFESFSIALPPVVATPTPSPSPSEKPLCEEATILPDQTAGLAGMISSTQFPFLFNYRVNSFQTMAAKNKPSSQVLVGTLNSHIQSVFQKRQLIRTEINRLKNNATYSQDESVILNGLAEHEEYLTHLEEASLYQLSLDSTLGLIDASHSFANLLQYYERLLDMLNTNQLQGLSLQEVEILTQKVEALIPKLRIYPEQLKIDLNLEMLQQAQELKELTTLTQDLFLIALFDAWIEEGLMDPDTGELTPPQDQGFSVQNARERFAKCIESGIDCSPQNPRLIKKNQDQVVKKFSQAREIDLQALVEGFKNRKTPLQDFLKEHKDLYLEEGARILTGYNKASWAVVGVVEKRALIAAFSELVFAVLPESAVEFLPVGKGFKVAEASIPQLAKAIKRFEDLQIKLGKNSPDLARHIDILIVQLRKRLETLQKNCSPCGAAGKYYSAYKEKFVSFSEYLLHKTPQEIDNFLAKYGHFKDYSIFFDSDAIPDFRKIKLAGRQLNGSELKQIVRAETKITPSTDYQELLKKHQTAGTKATPKEIEKAQDAARKKDKAKAIASLSKDPQFISELQQAYPGQKVNQDLIKDYLEGFQGHHSVFENKKNGIISFQFVQEDFHNAFKHEGSFALISRQ
ncbi:MAG: hypothetical protein IV090_21795, partial [Candidatus Sericytochromatia bacterium]|nr:hypothetical protein [Candidatus Sericytochromatia bacterium]